MLWTSLPSPALRGAKSWAGHRNSTPAEHPQAQRAEACKRVARTLHKVDPCGVGQQDQIAGPARVGACLGYPQRLTQGARNRLHR